MENIEDIFKKNGIVQIEEDKWRKLASVHNDWIIYNKEYPFYISFAKEMILGQYATMVEAEFQFNSKEELEIILNNFLHFDTGTVRNLTTKIIHENQPLQGKPKASLRLD